jgi:two-component system, OmpR family, sensor kinase
MSLRSRLFAGLALMLAALLVAGVVVGAIYRSSLTEQLDDRLLAYRDRAPMFLARSGAFGPESGGTDGQADPAPFGRPAGGPPGGLVGGLSDAYLGAIDSDGSIRTVLAPTDVADLVPILDAVPLSDAPFTARNAGVTGGRARVVVTAIGGSSTDVVIAMSTVEIERSFARLRVAAAIAALIVALVLGLVALWVVRLGLRPITLMTDVADAISGGRRDVRASEFPDGTEAARLSRALNAMIDETQHTEDRLRRFVADASHELRTPLTTLRGYTALYAAGGLPDEPAVADAMRRIGSEANRMGAMVDELLMLADLDEHRPIEHTQVDLAAILEDAAADARVVQPRRKISVRVSGPVDRLVVNGNAAHLAQAITALVANAIRHTPVAAAIDLSGTLQSGNVRLVVADDGPGIDAEHLPHLFERFYRADPSRARAGGGSGLGLSIVQAIVETHHGTVSVQSSPRQGTSFTIELPAA